jgi:glycosyltransferase involved in cell wall biosynthesis
MMTPPPSAPMTDQTAADLARLARVSVVIPSHNRRDRLERVVGALQRQIYPADKVEIIVVLDGCTDGSRQVLERLGVAGRSRLRVFEQPPSGPSVARNRGWTEATGELIVFIDDDVVATDQLLLEHAKAHCRQEHLVTIGTMLPPDDYARSIWIKWEEQMLLRQYRAMLEGQYRATYRQFFSGNCAVARRWLEAVGGFDSEFRRAEDVEIAFRLHRLGLTFAFLPQAEAHHYAHRPYRSWAACHYAYGYSDVLMERRRGLLGRIEIGRQEFQERHWPIRWLCRAMLDRRRAQAAANHLFRAAAQGAAAIRLPRLAYMSLSCVSNFQYWQGFNDALREIGEEAAPTVGAHAPGAALPAHH